MKSVKLPKRIVSLVPSQTELLFDLGLNESVVGVTSFCVHPLEECQLKTIIGGTKNPKLDKIHALKPDLILANKEENRKVDIELLAKDFPVWTSEVIDLETNYEMIRTVGTLTGKKVEAADLIKEIKSNFKALPEPKQLRSAVYLIWRKPYMSVGGDTFISSMLPYAGFRNLLEGHSRYPECSLDDLARLNPAFVLFSSEPYPFKERHFEEIQEFLPESKCLLVEGEYFSWYGSRMKYVPAYFTSLRETAA